MEKGIARIVKTDSSHNTVTFVVLEPGVEDRNGDIITKDEIIKTAHEFCTNIADKLVNLDHDEKSKIEKSDALFVETFVAPVDIPVTDDTVILAWSWCVAIKFSDAMMQLLIDGEIVGISMEWRATQVEIAI